MGRTKLLFFALALGAVCFTAFTARTGAASKSAPGWHTKISPDLLDEATASTKTTALTTGSGASEADRQVDVIVQFAGGNSNARAQAIQGLGGSVKKSLAVINGVAARMPLRSLEALSSRGDSAFISPDRPIQLMGHLEVTTGAAQVRSLVSGTNLDGSGVGIAILDSGIDKSHHELSYNGSTRISVEAAVSLFSNADDYGGHGTHVAAVAAGTGHVGPGAYTGIAPGAKIINVKVLDRGGKGRTSDLIDAVNWCVTYRNVYNIKIINMSLGAPAIDSYRNDPLCKAVRAAHDAGIVVVAAAGNDGKKADGTKLYGTIHSPGV